MIKIWDGPKTARIEMRCTPDELKGLKLAAKTQRLTVSAYLMRLHHIAVGNIPRKEGKG